MEKKLRTYTLDGVGGPVAVLCKGHVDQKTFNQAFKNEGWDCANYKQKELSYVYGTLKEIKFKNGEGGYRWSGPKKPTDKGVKPFTITPWD